MTSRAESSADAARGSDYAVLCRQIRQRRSARPPPRLLHRRRSPRTPLMLLGRLDGVRPARALVVPAARRGVPGLRVHPDRVRRARRRPPSDRRVTAAQRPARRPARQPARRAQLRLVGRQAQPPPRQSQPRGARPRHRHRKRPGLHERPRASPARRAGPGAGAHPGVPLLPNAPDGGPAPARRERPCAGGRPTTPDQDRRGPAAGLPPGGLPDDPVRRALAAAGGRVRPRAPVPVRPLHGLRLRAQPQGHAGPERRDPSSTSSAARC